MYFTAPQIARSIEALSNVHPFHGITFLACKKAGLPVGREIVFPLDAKTDKFLREHHRLDPGSDWFFQPFKSSDLQKKWVRPDYPAKGHQSVNTRTFGDAFLHPCNSRTWGWSSDYVERLQSRLHKGKKVPAFDLSVWLFRDSDWPQETDAAKVIAKFISDYSITPDEQQALFDYSLPREPKRYGLFQAHESDWSEIRSFAPAPSGRGNPPFPAHVK